MKERLAEDLADLYLDRDPTSVPDFAAASQRARLVIDIDPENLKARQFLIRVMVNRVDKRMKEGERNFSHLYGELNDIRRHADWLESRLDKMLSDAQDRIRGDLASFYDLIGNIKNSEGRQTTDMSNDVEERIGSILDSINTGIPRPGLLDSFEDNLKKHNRLLDQVREYYRESDRAFEKSLRLDPVNANARSQIEHHAKQYETIAELTKRNNEYLRHINSLRYQSQSW